MGGRPTVLIKQENHEAMRQFDDLLPTRRNQKARVMQPTERATSIAEMANNLTLLNQPGLRPIKQVELYSKWRPLLPKWAQNTTCPKPSDEVLEVVRKMKRSQTADKRNSKRAKKSVIPPTQQQKFST